jgi:hypothetical protein
MPELPMAIRYSRGTVIGWHVFILAFLGAGVVLAVAGLLMGPGGAAGLGLAVPGIALVAAFGALLLRARRSFGDPVPLITISEDAYHDRRLGDPIPWAAIRSLRRHKPGRRLFLQIEVDDPARYLGNAGFMARPMQRLNPAMGFAAVVSRLDGLTVPQGDIAAAAEARLARG